jgi:hypothetical protein
MGVRTSISQWVDDDRLSTGGTLAGSAPEIVAKEETARAAARGPSRTPSA